MSNPTQFTTLSPPTLPRFRHLVTEKRFPIPEPHLHLVALTVARMANASAFQPTPPYLDGTDFVVPLDSPACATDLLILNLWMRETADMRGLEFTPLIDCTPRFRSVRLPVDP